MSEFEQQLIADVRKEISDELASIAFHSRQMNFLREFLLVIDPSAGQPPKRKYRAKKKSKKRGRPTNAEIAAREPSKGKLEFKFLQPML